MYKDKEEQDKQKKKIGERLVKLRESIGLSQSELASLIGLSQSNLSTIEAGGRWISSKLAVSLGLFIDKPVNLNWLLTGQGPMLLDHAETTGEVNEPEQKYDPVSREEKEALEAQVRALEEKMKKLDKLEEQFAQLLQRLDNKD